MVRAGDRHRGMLCLPAVPHCAGHHLLQSHQAVSVDWLGALRAPQLGSGATPPTPIVGFFHYKNCQAFKKQKEHARNMHLPSL